MVDRWPATPKQARYNVVIASRNRRINMRQKNLNRLMLKSVNLCRQSVVLASTCSLTSILASFTIFSILGHMALVQSKDIAVVATQGDRFMRDVIGDIDILLRFIKFLNHLSLNKNFFEPLLLHQCRLLLF